MKKMLFGLLLPTPEFIIGLVKARMSAYAFHDNNANTRIDLEYDLNTFFSDFGIKFTAICNISNNTESIINDGYLVVDITYDLNFDSSGFFYNRITMGPRKWNKDTAVNFTTDQIENILKNQEFRVSLL